MVIGRAAAPRAFRAAVNNLPVVYKHNKRAWILSGLWYEYLAGLEKEMKKQGRHILLITNNCPSHPPPTEPPQNYPADAPAPPVLSHVALCYLPKNTTPFLQPLDAGIIRMFKAGYRRRFATYLVDQFDRTREAPLDIDILQSIRLISAAWDDIPPDVIFHCWQRTRIVASQNKETFPSYTAYTQYLQSLRDSTTMSITLLLTTSTNSQQVITLAEKYLDYNEDHVNLNISPEVVDITEIIHDLKDLDNEEEDLEDLQELYSPPSIPVITSAQARSHLTELVHYLETLSVSKLPGGGKPGVDVLAVRQQLHTLEQALTCNMHESRIQSSITDWFSPVASSS